MHGRLARHGRWLANHLAPDRIRDVQELLRSNGLVVKVVDDPACDDMALIYARNERLHRLRSSLPLALAASSARPARRPMSPCPGIARTWGSPAHIGQGLTHPDGSGPLLISIAVARGYGYGYRHCYGYGFTVVFKIAFGRFRMSFRKLGC